MGSVPIFIFSQAILVDATKGIRHLRSALLGLCTVMLLQGAYADRTPMLPEELVSEAEVIVWGVAGQIEEVHRPGEMGTTRRFGLVSIRFVGPELKGEMSCEGCVLEFPKCPEGYYPRPVQFEEGKEYLLFLKVREGSEYGLVSSFEGAVLRELLGQEGESRIKEGIKKDKAYAAAFQDVSVALSVANSPVSWDSVPTIQLEVQNTGTKDLDIPGRLTNDAGKLWLEGWMQLTLESETGEVLWESPRIHNRRTPRVVIPAGKSLRWAGPVPSMCMEMLKLEHRGGGSFRLRFKFGKAISDPAPFVLAPEDSGS